MISDHFENLETCSICAEKGENVSGWYMVCPIFGERGKHEYASFTVHSLICTDKEECEGGLAQVASYLCSIFQDYNDKVNEENFSEKNTELVNSLKEKGCFDFSHSFRNLANETTSNVATFLYPGKNRKEN